MKSLRFPVSLLVFTGLTITACDPHTHHDFNIDNTSSIDVEVVYTTKDAESRDTLVAAGDHIYIHKVKTEKCIDGLADETFSAELEAFLVLRDSDTLNMQVPGNMDEWEYEDWANDGAFLSPCSGEGIYTFWISDSLYPQ